MKVRVPPYFESRMKEIHRQMVQSFEALMKEDHKKEGLSAIDFFGNSVPKGSQTYYRKTIVQSKAVTVHPVTSKLVLGDTRVVKTLIEDPINVAELFWPEQLAEWQELRGKFEKAGAFDAKTHAAFEKVESIGQELMPQMTDQQMFAQEDTANQPDPVEENKSVTTHHHTFSNPELEEIEAGKLKLMHATAENMIYLRERLDGLINRPPTPMALVPESRIFWVEQHLIQVEEEVKNLKEITLEALAILRKLL